MKTSTAKTKSSGVDLTKLLAPYTSGWVALSEDRSRVVGTGKTLQEAQDQTDEHWAAGAVYVKVIPPDEGYLPLSL